ncbi:ABC transporter ATP-binding protein [Alkalicoccobacillus porphyridii]|uniref:ABC transporter ATP-binding protein n=1 Tax=Alkalicoccobacillus porphyridii TaxID=2597270 RepID=A0A553ZUC9_9BACI|nr:ABC transporter ATP-binding protein [Alkalicoccobacillus porphyridii]TSB45013.1 ABC transporter ATP-binding protein [Alkalicoccobacillus porphyridii]
MSKKQQTPPPKKSETQKPKDIKGSILRLLRYVGAFRWRLVILSVAAIIGTTFTILSPKILGLAVTELFQGVTGEGINFFLVLQILLVLGGLYLVSGYFSYIQEYVMVGIAQKVSRVMRREMNEKLSRLPLHFFDTRTRGDVLSRAINDLEKVSGTLQQSLTQLITSLITMIGVTIMMLTISPLLTLITMFIVPLSLLITKKVVARSQNYFVKQQQVLGILNGHVEEMYAGHQVIKAYGREGKSVDHFKKINGVLYDSGWRAQFISGLIMPFLSFVGNLIYVLVCVIGAIFVAGGRMAIGDIQAFIMYVRLFSQPIQKVANITNVVQSTVAAAERIFEILDEPEEKAESNVLPYHAHTKGNITFENVSFAYQKDQPLLQDVNIKVKQGQKVAIVGPTGAGKSTLMNLLLRFYDVDQGQITIDGTDIQQMRREDVRAQFGLVLQDPWLLSSTVKANIAYGHEGATEDEIVQAARAAHADHFIRTLPHGYETILNESGSNISQGQKQLLTIARALLSNPSILVLDEATANVDSRTEYQIQEALAHLMKGRTSFIIAHRLSTIRNADLILVMDQGKIVAQGSHDELLANGGFYANLHQQHA